MTRTKTAGRADRDAFARADKTKKRPMTKQMDVQTVQRMLESGMMIREIAEAFNVTARAVSHFLSDHNLRCIDGNVPPLDLAQADHIVTFRGVIDKASGARRIKRIPLPRISMHVAALENANG